MKMFLEIVLVLGKPAFRNKKNRTLEALEVEEEGKKREKQRAICSFPREPSETIGTLLLPIVVHSIEKTIQ